MTVRTQTKLSGQEAESRYWPPPQGEWAYEDYTRLPDNGMRYEVIQGELYISPAPNPKHQRIIAALYGYLWDYLKTQPRCLPCLSFFQPATLGLCFQNSVACSKV